MACSRSAYREKPPINASKTSDSASKRTFLVGSLALACCGDIGMEMGEAGLSAVAETELQRGLGCGEAVPRGGKTWRNNQYGLIGS